MTDYPRISTILEPYEDFSMVSEATIVQAQYRGTQVHQYAAAYALKLWVPIDNTYTGYFLSFQRWFDKFVKKVIYVEKKLEDPIYGFKGSLDFYGELNSLGMGLIDWKTPLTIYKSWKLRMAAYKRLLDVDKKKVDVVAALQLDPNGGIPKMVRYENSAQDLNIFLGILNGYKYFH